MTNGISQTPEELRQHFDEQLGFLRRSVDLYDEGHEAEAKRLATTLRLLLHDTGRSRSLAGQLQMLDREFLSMAFPHNPDNVMTHTGLVMMALGGKDRYVPHLDAVLQRPMPFADWWAEPVIVDDQKRAMSRRDLVLSMADQDGGAHVDPAINADYHRLTRQNSVGWISVGPSGKKDIRAIELASMRQIAHEVVKTFDPGYSKKVEYNSGILTGGFEITDYDPGPLLRLPQTSRAKAVAPNGVLPGRNDPCPCGGGRKFKKCHGSVVPPRRSH